MIVAFFAGWCTGWLMVVGYLVHVERKRPR